MKVKTQTRKSIDLIRTSISIPENRVNPWHGIFWRINIALLVLVINAVIVYLDREGYRDVNGDGLSWIDSLYYSGITLTTTGYGDITPVTQSARLLNFLLLTPLRFIFLAIFVGTAVEVLTKRGRQAFREARWRNTVKNQFVVIGFGIKGRSAVETLLARGISSKSIVVIENSQNYSDILAQLDVVLVHGDARHEKTLQTAEISEASQIIIAVDSDDAAVLITLVARRLNSKANIIVAVREGTHNETFKQSGANTVINTDESTGHILADSALAPLAGEIISDLLDPSEGLEVSQRKITQSDVGKKPQELVDSGELVISVIRNGVENRFGYVNIGTLQLGDEIVVVREVTT